MLGLALALAARRPGAAAAAAAQAAAAAASGRARRLSGRAPGPGDVEALLRALPPKPEAPSNDDCCMSGCELCVWDLYDQDMREYQRQAVAAREALEAQGRPVPRQLRPEHLRDSVDPAMRAFLDMEREMAMRIRHEAEEQDDD
ncbi:hypothetical protein H4R18_004561 [Coemansia javaensis]|uniref:Oxidoreductase-like domain-containing protein n=1 Tax=Coemansia javaensis TaxID=2761396 RepID=A0A9W8H7E5_9FUNG|nr:hypothetical protein H4R18_004561 [Coemansia javaensis]